MTVETAYARYLLGLQGLSLLPSSIAYPLSRRWGMIASPRSIEGDLVRSRFSEYSKVLQHATAENLWVRYLSNATLNHLNSYRYRMMTPRLIGTQITVTGAEHLKAAHSKGRGVLFLTGHQHHLVALGVTVGLLGYPTSPILMDPQATTPRFLHDYMSRTVSDSQHHYNGGNYILVDYHKKSVRALYRALTDGHVVPSANDFPSDLAPKRRMSLPFLGRSISCPIGSIEIALAHEAEFVTGYMRWIGRDRFNLDISPVLAQRTTGAIAKSYASSLEQAVRTDPGGWEGWKWPALFT